MVNNTVQDFYNEMEGVRIQTLYLSLINDRSDKIDDEKHKLKLLKGYAKIMNLVNRFQVSTINKGGNND
jgi:hypothetical protein